MPPLKAIEQATFGGVDSRSNPVNMPVNRWLLCRNWIPKPNGHLELREGYQLKIVAQSASTPPPTQGNPGTPIDPTQEMNHNTSAYAAYNQTNFAANFTGTSYISQAGATMPVDSTKMDDSLNAITPCHINQQASIHTLLPAYQTTVTLAPSRFFAHWTPWFTIGGGGGHINIGTGSTDPNWVDAAMGDMQYRGFNGIIIDWYGQGNITDQCAQLVKPRVQVHGFVYAIMIDGGSYTTTAQLETELAYINAQYLGDPNYFTFQGEPVVFFFGMVSGVDYATAKASVPRTMFWAFEGPAPAANAYCDGTFGWPNPWLDNPANHPSDPYNLAADNSYLTQVSGSGKKPCMPYVTPGFNGTLTKSVAWSQGKYMARDSGKCWLTKFSNLNSQIPPNTFGVQVATWNDWEEGTELESAIQNNITVTAAISGSIFQWSVAGGTGDETTMTGYRVIATQASNGWLIHTEATGGAKSIDLSTITGFQPGTPYSIYVVAQGIACVRNQVSNAVTYTNTSGGGGGGTTATAAYSPVAYTVETPAQSLTPGMYPNGTRCLFYWGEGPPTNAQNSIISCSYALQAGPIYCTYKVTSTAGFQQGTNVTVSGVTLDPTSVPNPPFSFNGIFPIISIGQGTITLQIGTNSASRSSRIAAPPPVFKGLGGGMIAVNTTPGGPEAFLYPLLQLGGSPTPIPVKGNPIASSARWHYALGKDGYLYMHNGVDAKFFDGACLRDIGLPFLTNSQAGGIHITEGLSAPPGTSGITFAWNTGGSLPSTANNNLLYYTFFDTSSNTPATSSTPMGGGYLPTAPASQDKLTINNLPTSSNANLVGLIGANFLGGAGATFLCKRAGNTAYPVTFSGSMVGAAGSQLITVHTSASVSLGDVIAIDMPSGGTWPSSGPFYVTAISAGQFQFYCPPTANPLDYNQNPCTFSQLLVVPSGTASVTISEDDQLSYQGISTAPSGGLQMPYVEDLSTALIPPSTVGGDQPGYQFWAAIYNPQTGHVGNRVPIGGRYVNLNAATFVISGLPDLSAIPPDTITSAAYYGYGANNINGGGNAAPPPGGIGLIGPIPLPNSDAEWRLLIGRTADGGEVPYACIDTNGNWITTTAANQGSVTISSSGIDNNSELPTTNYPPPAFSLFWREGDRICGGILNQPFVYRSASEVDATTGIYVGNPAQSWDPSKVETFPTGEALVGCFGCMQESWCFTRNDVAQLSELSGEVVWNGPYSMGFGAAGSFAFDKGWNSLPFWVSHDKQLCTMLPGSNGPVSISTEYETALLSRIGADYDDSGNQLAYMAKTEVVYFRDPERLIDVLRIRCFDANGVPFTIIHDFNLRDDSSPYGQGYEETYLGPLAQDYQSVAIRDHYPLPRVWATASDGAVYQFYSGGLDNTDPYDPSVGNYFTADAIGLRYISGERTAVKTIEWYGDELIQWYIFESMINVMPPSYGPGYWVNVTYEMRPVPGETGNAHWMCDLNRPEMMHCYLWAQLIAHPMDAPVPMTPMDLNDPPHIPLESYGRLYLAAPLLGDTRGR